MCICICVGVRVFVNPPLSDCDNWSTLVIFCVLCTIVCNTVARLCVCVQRWPRGEDDIYYSRAAPSGERVPTTLPTSDEETWPGQCKDNDNDNNEDRDHVSKIISIIQSCTIRFNKIISHIEGCTSRGNGETHQPGQREARPHLSLNASHPSCKYKQLVGHVCHYILFFLKSAAIQLDTTLKKLRKITFLNPMFSNLLCLKEYQ